MKQICVIYDGTIYTYRWLSALLASKKIFAKHNYSISIPGVLHSINQKDSAEKLLDKIKHTDIIMLAFHPGGKYYQPKERIMRILQKARKKCEKIVWLDTSDSAGTTFFEVMPYVDKYLKKQTYVDLSLYNKELCRDRLFCEYYSKRPDVIITDDDVPHNIPIDAKNLKKLGISWNVGLGILFERNKYRFIMNLDRRKDYIDFLNPNINKRYDIFYRGSLYNSITGFQRKLAIDSIMELTCIHPDPNIRVSQEEYDKEILESKTILSPFGWGEICTRDFEAFKNGALLIKPDMSHLKTYPDYFVDGKTYVSINWDFLNLNDKLQEVLADTDKYYFISRNGQEIYKKSLSLEGKEDFVRHILKEIDV